MSGSRRPAILCLLGVLLVSASVGGQRSPVTGQDRSPRRDRTPATPAILVLDLPSGRTLSAVQPDALAIRLPAGPVLQVAALAAALEAGVVTPDSSFTCRRRISVDGRPLLCSHPDPGGPMTPARALTLSCSDFFASLGQRLPRERMSAMTAALGLGSGAETVSMPLLAAGVGGLEAKPEQLLRALVRAVDPASGVRIRRDTRDVLLAGLRGAAREGDARAIGGRAIDAVAVTWTAAASGGSQGVALALSPSARASRAVAVMLPGGSAGDAAALAAETLAELIDGTYWQSPGGGLQQQPRAQDAGGAAQNPAGAGSRPRDGVRTAEPGGPASLSAETSAFAIRVGRQRVTGGYGVTAVPLEEYVARVLAGEAAARSAPAALEALAVAVRTFAISNSGRHRADGFDLCDTTHCQVMAASPTAATRAAAAATAGQILTYHGQPASIFYTASCGGESELPSDVWPRAQDQPFLTRHKDAECRQASEWTADIAGPDLLRALNAAGLEGDELRNVRVSRRSGSGRAAVVRAEGLDPDEISGDDLRAAVGRTLGWQLVKSTAFDVKRTSHGYRFTGRGSGHGVGLCVIGSARMAAQGKSAARILAEYFPGTSISSLSTSSSR